MAYINSYKELRYSLYILAVCIKDYFENPLFLVFPYFRKGQKGLTYLRACCFSSKGCLRPSIGPSLCIMISTCDVSNSIVIAVQSLESIGEGLTALFFECHLVFAPLMVEIKNM